MDAILAVLGKLDDGCRGTGPMFKAKKMAAVRAAMEPGSGHHAAGNDTPKGHAETPLAALAEGVNEGKALHARAVLDATAEDMLNLHYIIVDKDGTLAALSVYGLEDGAVRLSSTLTLLNPNVREVDAGGKGGDISFGSSAWTCRSRYWWEGRCPWGASRGRGWRARTCDAEDAAGRMRRRHAGAAFVFCKRHRSRLRAREKDDRREPLVSLAPAPLALTCRRSPRDI